LYLPVDETLQLGLDCFGALSPGHALLYGWAMTPRGEETSIRILAGAAGECAIEHCSFHPRPDIAVKNPMAAVVSGFCLVFTLPPETHPLVFTLRVGREVVRADLRGGGIVADAPRVTAERDWQTTFGLLHAAVTDPGLQPMLAHRRTPFGAFGEWVSRVPTLRGRAAAIAGLAEAEAVATPAGEVLAMLRTDRALGPEADVEAVLVGWLRGAAGESSGTVLLTPADLLTEALPGALAIYARAEAGWADRLASFELILQARLRGEERLWLRAIPAGLAASDLLDAASRATPADTPAPSRAAAAGLELARRIAARRAMSFAGPLAALSEIAQPGPAPRTTLILGADDPMAALFFQARAAEVEAGCDALLVLGDASASVARVFDRRGRLEVRSGEDAAEALRRMAGCRSLRVLDAARHAEAIAEGREGGAGFLLDGAGLARLLALHAVAGGGPALPDTLARLAAPARTAARFAPMGRGWSSPAAGTLANEHLAGLWRAARPAEAATHG
jgi:hypothetical protein